MPNKVGPKGQVVIEKEIRDSLGVQPGFFAVQRLVGDDRVEITFIPAEHRDSLRGFLKRPDGPVLSQEEFEKAREEVWADPDRLGNPEDW